MARTSIVSIERMLLINKVLEQVFVRPEEFGSTLDSVESGDDAGRSVYVADGPGTGPDRRNGTTCTR